MIIITKQPKKKKGSRFNIEESKLTLLCYRLITNAEEIKGRIESEDSHSNKRLWLLKKKRRRRKKTLTLQINIEYVNRHSGSSICLW